MKLALKTGIYIGLACVIWILIMGYTGWYKHPQLLNLFWLVVPVEIGLLIHGLAQTSREKTYAGQLWQGTLMSLIAAVIIFAGSYLFTTVLFPRYFEELQAIRTTMLQGEGKTEAEIATALAAAQPTQTPFFNALSGAMGTIFTGVVASLIIAIPCRRK